MHSEALVFLLGSLTLLVFALTEGVSLLVRGGKVVAVTGIVIQLAEPGREQSKKDNVSLARIGYIVDGHYITSANYIVVPRCMKVGDSLTVRYYKKQPEQLYNHTCRKFSGLSAAACACGLISLILFHK